MKRDEAEKILSKHLSDSDVRWRGCKDKVIDAMIEVAQNQGQSLPIDSVVGRSEQLVCPCCKSKRWIKEQEYKECTECMTKF